MGALAAVARQSLQERGEVGVLADRGEVDRVAIEVVGAVLGGTVVGDFGRGVA